MDGENRRSREAVRNSIRTYGVKVMDPASLPLKKTNERESQESVSRFSEKSLHSQYRIREGFCNALLHRVPFATLFATVLCILGIVIFCVGRHRGSIVTITMISDVLNYDTFRVAVFDIVFLVIEIVTAVVAVMVLIVGILATGETRARVYGACRARTGGRVCCAVLMVFVIILFFVWLLIFWLFVTLFFVLMISKTECDFHYEGVIKCLHLPILYIFVPFRREEIEICEAAMITRYCKGYVEKVSSAYITCVIAVMMIIFSLVLFLICLASNYARIRCQAKFQELDELRHLEGDLHNSKDRF